MSRIASPIDCLVMPARCAMSDARAPADGSVAKTASCAGRICV